MTDKKRLVVELPPTKHKQLKQLAVNENTTMKSVVEKLIEERLRNNES